MKAMFTIRSGCPFVAGGLLDCIGIAGASAGRRESLLRRQDRADDRRLRRRRRLRCLLAADRALSRQDAGDDGDRRERARRRRPRCAEQALRRAARRPADFARPRHHGRRRATDGRSGRTLRPCQVHLPRDRRRAARPLAGRAGFSDPRGPAGDRRQDEMAMGLRGRNVGARHRRGLHLRGAEARLSYRAGLQGQRRCRTCGHARRDGRGLCAGIVRQPFREEQAELGAGDDLAHQVAVLPGPADRFRGGQDRCRPALGDGLPRQSRRARPPA